MMRLIVSVALVVAMAGCGHDAARMAAPEGRGTSVGSLERAGAGVVAVVDESGAAVAGADVSAVTLSMNGTPVETDARGLVRIETAISFQDVKWVKVEKAGFESVQAATGRWPLRVVLKRAATLPVHETVERFMGLRKGMTMNQAEARVGLPERETGSGVAIEVYRLADGTEMWLGFGGGNGLLYVRHGVEGPNLLAK